jgi:hypothetical protein
MIGRRGCRPGRRRACPEGDGRIQTEMEPGMGRTGETPEAESTDLSV